MVGVGAAGESGLFPPSAFTIINTPNTSAATAIKPLTTNKTFFPLFIFLPPVSLTEKRRNIRRFPFYFSTFLSNICENLYCAPSPAELLLMRGP